MIDYEQFYSANAKGMKESELKELLKFTNKPGIISFAGGYPAPDLFPVAEITEIINDLMAKGGTGIFQYGAAEGYLPLREELVKFMKKQGVDIALEQLVIITSSQQGLDLVGKVFLSPGDVIMTGKPTYIGAIMAFNCYSAQMCGIELDDDGIDTALLEKEIKNLIAAKRKPKCIYVVPDFQNPSGITISLDRRKELIRIAEEYDLLIVEDSPYRQLRFEGEPEPPLVSLNSERVLSLYTFSKILLPGFRLGWMIGPEPLIRKSVIAKMAGDICAPPFNQAVVAEFLKRELLEGQIEKIIAAYREKRDLMLAKLAEYMPEREGLKWTHPNGGLFLWLTLPENMDATEMFRDAVEKKVAYVVGQAFDPEGKKRNTMRLNFSFASLEQIDEGVKRLAQVIKSR
ncbi:MAG: PLP-dependent aminotransferase family protein [Candidatus Aminicenantes bacterium]|nr:PLP-dependent aminotransferase family protein [Candidatus Aminicenantes bacterium]